MIVFAGKKENALNYYRKETHLLFYRVKPLRMLENDPHFSTHWNGVMGFVPLYQTESECVFVDRVLVSVVETVVQSVVSGLASTIHVFLHVKYAWLYLSSLYLHKWVTKC